MAISFKSFQVGSCFGDTALIDFRIPLKLVGEVTVSALACMKTIQLEQQMGKYIWKTLEVTTA